MRAILLGAAVVSSVLGAGRAAADSAPTWFPPPRGPCSPIDLCSWAEWNARRGPIEIRDAYLVAQPRLTLPAVSPDTLGRCVTTLRGQFHWSSSFGFHQDDFGDGEDPIDRRFLVDGEARTVEATLTRGLTDHVDVGLRLPVHWRGGGILDALIDDFHEATSFVTLDNDRPEFDRHRFRVHGRTSDGDPFSWDDENGTGLGDLEAFAKWRVLDGGRDGWSGALVGRVSLPTGTGPFDGNGVGLGVQAVAAKRLGPRFDLFLGVGGTAQTDDAVDGIDYEPFRGHAFAALEWRPVRFASLVLTTDYATRLAEIEEFAPEHWYVHLSAKVDLSDCVVFEIGTTENLMDQHTTADFGVHFGLVVRL